MKRFLAWLAVMWKLEPVRVRFYSVVGLIMGLMVYRGIVTGNEVAYIMAGLAALIGVPATESARAVVTPTEKLKAFPPPGGNA